MFEVGAEIESCSSLEGECRIPCGMAAIAMAGDSWRWFDFNQEAISTKRVVQGG